MTLDSGRKRKSSLNGLLFIGGSMTVTEKANLLGKALERKNKIVFKTKDNNELIIEAMYDHRTENSFYQVTNVRNKTTTMYDYLYNVAFDYFNF
jgi:precorrin-6B methylase 2